eukprot:4362294-Prymnesium_polylepis.1
MSSIASAYAACSGSMRAGTSVAPAKTAARRVLSGSTRRAALGSASRTATATRNILDHRCRAAVAR